MVLIRRANGGDYSFSFRLAGFDYLSFSKTVELARHDWQTLLLYNVLDYYYGIKVERAEDFLEPLILAPEEAELL